MLNEEQNAQWARYACLSENDIGAMSVSSPETALLLYLKVQKISEAFGRISELEKELADLKKKRDVTDGALKRTIDNLTWHTHSQDGRACTPLSL